MNNPRKGNKFVHKSFRDPGNPHNRDARAEMRITSVRQGKVYYTYATEPSNKGAWYMPVDKWREKYGWQ